MDSHVASPPLSLKPPSASPSSSISSTFRRGHQRQSKSLALLSQILTSNSSAALVAANLPNTSPVTGISSPETLIQMAGEHRPELERASSSRSQMLLRSTLLRDEQVATAKKAQMPAHRRRHSHAPNSTSSNSDATACNNTVPCYSPQRSGKGYYTGDQEARRPCSPSTSSSSSSAVSSAEMLGVKQQQQNFGQSPLQRARTQTQQLQRGAESAPSSPRRLYHPLPSYPNAHHTQKSQQNTHSAHPSPRHADSSSFAEELTPHEQVLRARLERVLNGCQQQLMLTQHDEGDALKANRTRKRTSLPANSIQATGGGVFGWLWRDTEEVCFLSFNVCFSCPNNCIRRVHHHALPPPYYHHTCKRPLHGVGVARRPRPRVNQHRRRRLRKGS